MHDDLRKKALKEYLMRLVAEGVFAVGDPRAKDKILGAFKRDVADVVTEIVADVSAKVRDVGLKKMFEAGAAAIFGGKK